jgi:vancomycin resistance protein YoaR
VAGRSGNPVEQTLGAVLRRLRPDRVDLVVSYRPEGVEGVLDGWQAATLTGAVEGALRFEGTRVVEVEPRAGTGILRDEARRRIVAELRSASREPVELPTGRVEPVITRDEVRRAAQRARTLLAAPHEVVTDSTTLTIAPEQLVLALGTEIRDRRLDVTIDAEALRDALGEQLATIETEPVEATFEVTSAGSVRVVPSVNGRQIDMDLVADAILDGDRRIPAPLREAAPERDTAWAESMRIKELVSTFTTNHRAGEARVTNIHRAADVVDNMVVEPGEVFSLNDAIGPRTAERGFVVAPVFYGEFTEDYGGGVSQLATTFFNAVFFGGYEDVYHKPHTIYISRYPQGREATVNYPTVDLKFRNDSSAGILIRTSYTSTSITVSFYGDKEGRTVREVDRKVLAERPPEDRYYDCPGPEGLDKANICATLPDREVERVEAGYPGLDVEYYRVIERPGQEPTRERFFWRYRMTPNVYLVGTAPATTTTTATPPPSTTSDPAVPPTTAPAGTATPP